MARSKRLRSPREELQESTDSDRRGGSRALLLLLWVLFTACRSAAPSTVDQAATAWAEGPVRWLLQEEEREALREVRTAADLTRFVSAFWKSRDPEPESEENLARQTFSERVTAADRLYGRRPGRPGSLTPRGRALILLGAPTILRYVNRSTPAWTPESSGSGEGRPTRSITEEVWGYPPQSLPETLRGVLAERGETELFLSFVEREGEEVLTDGEDLLLLAAAAAVRSPLQPPAP